MLLKDWEPPRTHLPNPKDALRDGLSSLPRAQAALGGQAVLTESEHRSAHQGGGSGGRAKPGSSVSPGPGQRGPGVSQASQGRPERGVPLRPAPRRAGRACSRQPWETHHRRRDIEPAPGSPAGEATLWINQGSPPRAQPGLDGAAYTSSKGARIRGARQVGRQRA